MNRRGVLFFVLAAAVLAQGCSVNRATAKVSPGVDLGKVKTVYVVQEKGDDRAIDRLILAQLTQMGYAATSGPEIPRPYKADASLDYADKWMWDLTMYMLELTVTVKNPENGSLMAVGNSFHTSLSRKAPESMVEEVLTNIFRNAPAAGGEVK